MALELPTLTLSKSPLWSILNLTEFEVDVLANRTGDTSALSIEGTLAPCDDRLLPYTLREEEKRFNRDLMEHEVTVNYTLRIPERTRQELCNPDVKVVLLADHILELIQKPKNGPIVSWGAKVRHIVRAIELNRVRGTASLGRRYLILEKEDLYEFPQETTIPGPCYSVSRSSNDDSFGSDTNRSR